MAVKFFFFSFRDGELGMLRTNEKYQNRGYGSLLVKTMVEEVKSRGLIPVVLIEEKRCQE